MDVVSIVGLGTANPPLRVSQEEVYRFYRQHISLSEEAQSLLRRVLVENRSIGFRHLGMEGLAQVLDESPDDLIARFERFAVPTAVAAARGALSEAGLAPAALDALVVSTCTGYLCPGLSSYVAEALGIGAHVRPYDLVGMGCGGALPNLELAANHLRAHPGDHVLSIAVEICSATIYFSEDPEILVSNAIFGDGAAAAVLSDRGGGIRLVGAAAGLFPQHRGYLRYVNQEGKLRNVLSPRVPVLGARHSQRVIDRLLAEQGLGYGDVDHWIVHPGGERVLDGFQRQLGLSDQALLASRRVLYRYGNMSSPSVLFVLEEVRRQCEPQAGEIGLLCSFGAGFSAFAALVRFC